VLTASPHHLFQFSLRSRCSDDARWIPDLDPGRTPSRSTGAVDTFRDDSLDTRPHAGAQTGLPILGEVFIEQGAGLGVVQRPRQRGLAVEKWEIAQLLAVMLDEVRKA